MKVDRKKAQETFAAYVENYNSADSKVRLKIEHTARVAMLCEKIAKSIGLEAEEADLAWLIGLLHDIGRFEQLRRYGTFIDAESVDHAQLGGNILFCENVIRDYVVDSTEDELIEAAVRYHNVYRVPEGLSQRVITFCDIIRDADKIDILKVNVEFPLEEIYNVTTKELKNAEVTEAVMESFKEEHATLRSLKQTPVDHVVGHISLIFELVYPISLMEVMSQGYLDKLLHFESDNEKTREQFKELREMVDTYIKGK